MKEQRVFPDVDDYLGAAEALNRLSDTYQIGIPQMRTGDIKGFKSVRPLNGYNRTISLVIFLSLTVFFMVLALECFELGRMAFELADHRFAAEWLSEAIKDYDSADSSFSYIQALEYLANSSYHVIFLNQKPLDSSIYNIFLSSETLKSQFS